MILSELIQRQILFKEGRNEANVSENNSVSRLYDEPE